MKALFAIPYNIILQSLIFLYPLCFNNLGLAIIALTILVKAVLIPFAIPMARQQKKMKELQPKVDELKAKHKGDKMKIQEEQMKLWQEHGINPLQGCLPQFVQMFILIALYWVFQNFLKGNPQINGHAVSTQFLWFNLAKNDPFYILPVVVGLTQYIFAKMMAPAKKLEIKKNDSKEEKQEKLEFSELFQEMSGQMTTTLPLFIAFTSLTFPAGMSVYWIVSNIFSIVQQYFVFGPGELKELAFWRKKRQK